ncbi:EF-hand domain-containing protein [Massilia sp. 9096]|uniref:EF-hand domain-containing protein n=1 Tax=Massilia sp. 9096 TaxID=1500894 RepID=UPI000AF98528|nr:EF-hand domain-containing protein [Massilia sp. 9096]
MNTAYRAAYRAAAVAVSLAAFAVTVPAFARQAQDPAQGQHQWQGQRMTPEQRAQRMAERFNAADTNHDGKLSLDEAKAGMPMVARHFDEIDTGHAGAITLEQMNAYAQAHMGQRQHGGGGGGNGGSGS